MAAIATVFLILAFTLATVSVGRARSIARILETRYPAQWRAMGRPRPGFLPSIRRTRFAQFILRREYEQLGDAAFTEQCERLRRFDLLMLAFLFVGFLGLGATILWERPFG